MYTGASPQPLPVQQHLARLLLRQIPLLSLANITLAAGVTLVLWNQMPSTTLSGWLATVLLVTAIRWIAARQVRLSIERETAIRAPMTGFALCSLLTGLSWGWLCYICVGQLGLAQSVVPILATAGLVAGAATGTSSVLPAFVFYCVGAMLPTMAALLLLGTVDGYVLTAFGALHLLFTLGAGRTNNRQIRQSLQNNLDLEQANARANALADHLRHLSSLDQVTDLANRRGFDQALGLEWRRAMRTQAPLCMLLCDIDYFKHYNDSLGHQAGDRCLRQVAQALRARCMRAGDVVARFGGEEFAIIAPNTSPEKARVFAEIICAAVSALKIPHPNSSVSSVVTITVGGAVLQGGNYKDASALIEAADAAMYRAKALGRNRALVSSSDEWVSVASLAS